MKGKLARLHQTGLRADCYREADDSYDGSAGNGLFAECEMFQGIFGSYFWEWQEVKRFSVGMVDAQTS